ncbi:hypothetical protein UCREL1_6993 [Eutypa lata UCREL1]|uniref:Uncharacterized protein n=1 Tax=Eutypa lata (strain UCR-EL1) TaxID=1287681 RepID=M7TH13_EUTLA|nr:hypothetical protein UCREL1_6993 [Eutypa lata UCREL1]
MVKPYTNIDQDGYVDLRNEHYSKAMVELEKAETELTTEFNESLKSDHRKLEILANQSAQLHGLLSDEDAEYSAKGVDGQYRTSEAQAEIESLSKDLASSSRSDNLDGQDSDWKNIMNAIEGSDGSTANLEAELEELIKEAAEDFKKQEKKFLEKIENAGRGVFMKQMFD